MSKLEVTVEKKIEETLRGTIKIIINDSGSLALKKKKFTISGLRIVAVWSGTAC